ncbi:hypothetical protein [Variovorax atrisoli]|uniref:hypothetical protein n=1 Tax=Variovorax atrisoli TaxID=3394203 RepID=UPI00403FE322
MSPRLRISSTGIEDPGPADPERLPFIYRGWRFECSVRPVGSGCFEPVVVCLGHGHRPVRARLPNDTDEIAYATRTEAMRHAQQQAMRWGHDRTGDGQGQF